MTLTTTSPQAMQLAEERAYTRNLERENKLMASAYHDLAGRLQMNNVVLQRRADAPKSWLGRQRKAMEGIGGLVR
jgi:protein HOOK3